MAFSALESLTKKKDTGGTTNASGNSISTNTQPAFSALNTLAQKSTPQRSRYSFVPAERHPVTMVNNVINGYERAANLALRNGTYNAKTYNNQYTQIKNYLDDLEKDTRYSTNGTVKALRNKLDSIYDSLNPKKVEIPTYSKQGNITFNTQNLTTQPRQNMPTYNGGNPFANPSAMAIQNSTLGRLNNLAKEKIANDARLREDAYMRGIGASNNANTDRELQTLQNLYKNAQESRYKQTGSLGNYGPNATETPIYKDLRAAGETYDPTRSNPAAPGKDDGEDFWQKYERIQREHPEFTEDQIYDYIENEPRANYTPVQKSPLADDSIFTRANNAINTELENRSFLREYAPNYLNEEFAEKSKYANRYGWHGDVPEVGTQAARGPLGGSLTDDEYARMFYESVNGNQAATDYLTKVKDPETGELLEYDYGQQRYMYDGKNKSVLAEALQDDERGMFNYLYATQGADAAMKYYEGLLPALNQRWTAAYNEELQEKMKDPGLAILYNAFTTATKPITAIASVANQVYDLAKNHKIDANDPKYAMLNGANLVRAATSKAINNDVLSFLYEGAMSTIDNIYGTMLGSKIADVFGIAGDAANKVTKGIVLGLMTTDAAQASVLSNIQSGMDTTSAITNGLMSGAIEFITEKIGLDNFFNSMWYGKEKWVSLAKQILSEGGEEVVGNTMDDAWGMLYDRLTGLSTSDWRREMNAYILENGLAPDDELTAFNAVFEQHLLDTAKAGLMGGFSGGIMGGFGMGRGAVDLNNQVGNIMPYNISFSSSDSSAPANVRLADVDQVQGLIEEGLSYDPTTKAYKKAAKLQTMLDTGRITDSQAIDLYKELVKADVTNESHATPELSSIDRSGETRPQTAFPMNGPSVNVPGVTAKKFVPQELYQAAVDEARNQDNTTTGVTGISAGEAENLISDIFNEGLTGQINPDINARAQRFIGPEYTEAIRQAGVQARDTNRRTAFGPTFNMPAQEMVQRDQLIEDVASGYDSAGRTSMGEVMRAFNPFKNHAVTDMSTADYVSEISAVYNAAAQNQEIPPTPHLTQQAAQAAINAAKMDRIYMDEGITSAEQAEMEAPEETAAVKPAEYTAVEKTAEQRDTDYDYVQDYAGEVATADGQGKFGSAVVNNYYDDMDANAYTAGAQAILEQAQQGVPLENVTLPAQAQKFISPQLKAELYNAVNTQEALGNASNTQEVINGTEESGNVPVPGSSGRGNSTDTGIESETVAGRTGQTETTGSPANVRTNVRTAFHYTGQTATAKSLGIDTGTDVNEVQIVELDDTEENNQLQEIATAAHKKLVTFVGNNLSTTGRPARGVITGDTIYVRADHPTLTPLQIGKHEVMHGELRGDTNHKINTILNHLRALTDASFVDNTLIPAYKARYATTGMSDLRVLEEMLCDIYGEMNEWKWKDLPGMEEMFNSFLSKGAQIVHETARNLNQTAEAVTEVRNNGPPTEATMEAAKGDTNDAQFSLEFADAIAKRQEDFFDKKATNLIYDKKLFQKAVADTNRMVQTMIEHRDILPTDKVGKVLVKNGSYDVSVENTTICIRTLAYNQFVDMVQDKIGRPLTQMESFLVSQKMYDIAVDPQCLYCYVSLDRKAYNEFLGRYIDDRDAALKAYEKAGKPAVNKITKTSPLFEEFLHGRKATDNMLARYKSWLNAYNNGEHLLTKADLKTELKRAEIMQTGTPVEIAQMKDILAYAQSASWSKKQMDYVAYNGEILKMGKQTVNNLNKHYGLRFYSFSDYSGAFIVENMQEVMDASLKGLKGLAYTKDVDFARIFADTGMNINISVFAKFNPETEQYEIDPLQSANLEDAIALRNKKKNVGIVVVATDTEGVRWAMHQDWSDVVIPFHTVRTGKDVADFYNWQIFTGSQNDVVDPAKQNLWDDYVKSTGKNPKNVSKMIYPSEHNNDYDTYMKLINERGLTPRFNEFRLDENGNVDPTYMKLVNETRQSAEETNPMVPVFDLTAADESFRKFVDKGGYFGGWYNDGVNVDAEAQIVADDVLAGKTAKDVTYGRQDINPEQVQASRKTNRSHQRMSTEATAEDLAAGMSAFMDSEGNTLTNEQADYFKDSKVRDASGNLQLVYHGSPATDITEFDRGRAGQHTSAYGDKMIWFTDDEQFADDFSYEFKPGSSAYTYTRGEKGRVYPGYLNITNPFDLTNPTQEMRDYLKSNEFLSNPDDIDRLFEIGNHQMLKMYLDYSELQNMGYDGIIAKTDVQGDTLEYGVFNSNQFKAADNLKPTTSQDIRYSKEIEGQTSLTSKSQEDVAADLKKRVAQLEKKAEYFKGQTQLSALTPGSAAWKNMTPLINEYQAKKILRSVQDFYGSTTDVSAFTKDIQRLVTYLASRSNGNKFEIVNEAVYHIAKKIVENTQVIVEDDGSEILKDIRKTTIKVSPRVQHDIADYNKWRMSHFGKMKLSTNKGTDVTEYYNELTEKFGEAAFPSDINTATDQLLYIADFVDNYQPVTQNPYSYDMAALTQDAALTLYNEMLNADLFKPTYADKQNARIEKLQQESTERIEKLQQESTERVQEVRRQARQQRDDQIQKIKDHAKDVAARRRARKEEQNARQKLIRLARRLNSMKTTKANRALIDELIGNLDTVAYSLTEGKAASLMELNAWYETQKETNPDFVAHADLVQKQFARLTQKHIADMTVSEILDLTKSLMTLENDIRTQNKLINTKMNEDALQAGIKAIRDIDNARGIDKGLRRTIDNLIVQGTLSPTRFMHRLTGYNDSDPLYQAVAGEDGLAGGQRKMLDYQYRAGKLFEEWLSDRKFTRWFTGTKAEILSYDIVTADGQQRTIQMTPAMRTTLYLAAMDKGWMQHMCGRDTMDKHIAGGGIVLPDIKSYRKGNIADAYDSGTVKVKLTKSFLDKLGQDMTEQELKFAKAIHDYFSGMSKNEINAVSELLLGRSIAEVGDYLPISVDKNFLDAEYGAIKYDGTITGMGSLQERQSSYKPVIVRDITDILKQSIESTSKYVGLAIPIRNFNKIMGVTIGHTDKKGVYQNFEGSVLESIANKWGKKAQTYIENMISDLQMPNNSQEDLEKMFAKIRSKYAGAVLTLNASVALKQAASYPTAAAVLGWKPLMQAFQNSGHVDLNFIAKWTPLQWYRTKGFSTTELGDIQNQNNIFTNMPKGLNWIQGMDLITTRKLWKAAEYYVRDNNPELYKKGAGERGQSDAFYRAVADIYNKTIEETQPNYTALQRPEYLRSKSGLVRTLMMFKTQPMQNFNVIYDAVGDFQAKRAQYRNNADSAEAQQAYAESGKRLRRAVTSQIGQLITFAAMTMLWNMFRRKKEKYTDEEGNVSLEKIAESMGKDIGSGVFGMVPFGSEVWSFISSKIFGDKYYGFESVTDSAISDFLNAGSSAWELIGKIIEDDEPFNITTYKKKLKTVLSSASKIMGIPFDNLYNTVTAGYMRGRDVVDGLFNGNKNLADYWALSWTEDASKDKAEFFDILYNAHMDGKEGEYEEILQLMIDSGEYGKEPEETIADGLQDTFIKHTTHVKGEPDSDAKYRLYDYMYKHQEDADYEKLHEDALFFGFSEDDIEKGIRNSLAAELIGVPSKEFNKDGLYGHLYSIFDTPEYKTKHDTLTANGWTEDEITDGLKKAYGVQLTGIDSSDYKNADLFTYLYDMKQTNSAGYTAATKEMKKIGYTDDNITDGMKKAYGMQVTGVTEEYSTAVLFDYLYDLKKNHVSNYNAELTKMKGVGFTDKNISDGMKDAYGRAVTGLGSDYTAEALYTTVYKNNKSNLSGKVSEMKGFGFSEQSIRDGLKQAYGASATGKAYKDIRMDDVYDYIYGLYNSNSTKFASEYQTMLNVGFTEKAIKDGIEARMKEAYGVDNVKKLPHRFAAPDHTLPSYWTYKNDDKDTGPVKESGTVTGSSHVGGYEYDNGELTIYMNGRPYTYHGVPESVFEDFKAAGSKGGFVNDYIKGKYSYN